MVDPIYIKGHLVSANDDGYMLPDTSGQHSVVGLDAVSEVSAPNEFQPVAIGIGGNQTVTVCAIGFIENTLFQGRDRIGPNPECNRKVS